MVDDQTENTSAPETNAESTEQVQKLSIEDIPSEHIAGPSHKSRDKKRKEKETAEKEPAVKKKVKKRFPIVPFWVCAVMAAAAFVFIFSRMPMFPYRWKLIAGAGAAVVMALMGLISFTARKRRPIIAALNIMLAVVMTTLSVIIPNVKQRVSKIIVDNQISSGTVKVNLYMMSDAYKEKHPEIEWMEEPDLSEVETTDGVLRAWIDAGAVLLTSQDNDELYLAPAVETLLKFDRKAKIVDKATLNAAAEDLYAGKGNILFMTESVAYMIRDMEEYKEWEDDVKVLYTIYVDEVVEEEVVINDRSLTDEPFSIFFGGNDTMGELSLAGRTDVCMIVTVNPVSHQIVISSFPRDSYVPNPGLGYRNDKLTHLGMRGIQNTLITLSDLLGTPIDNYILINFTTYMKIIDALGGVDVDNPYAFTYTWDHDYYYPEGRIHLDAQAALYYVRERYSLPDGDFGRNMHQQLVMQAIIRKVSSPAVIANFNELLNALEGTFLTNLSDSSIYGFCQYQLQENISWNVVTNRAEGAVGFAVCASAPSQELSVVFPYTSHVQYMAEVIDAVEAGEVIEQEEMPAGYSVLYGPLHLEVQPEEENPEETEEPEAVEPGMQGGEGTEVIPIIPTPETPTVNPEPEPPVEPETPPVDITPTPEPPVVEPEPSEPEEPVIDPPAPENPEEEYE